MKTPSTDLYQLIRSLSPQEKKYFTQYSQLYSEGRSNNYLLLFDAIAEQQEYDEPAIKEQFAQKDFVKNLGVAKIYLTEKILDALTAMYAETDEAVLLKNRITHFELLSKRKLMNGALAAYDKAYDLAIETGSVTLLPHIIRQKNLMLSHHEKKFSGEEFIANALQAIDQTKILENFLQYELLSIRCNLLYTDSTLGIDPAKMQQLDDIMAHPLLQGSGDPLSFRAWFHFTRIKYRYYFTKGSSLDCYDLLMDALAYLTKCEKPTHEWQTTNFHIYVDLIQLCFSLRYMGEMPGHLSRLNEYIKAGYQPLVALKHTYFAYILRYHAESGIGISDGIEYWEKQKKWWQTEQHKFEVQTRGIILFTVLKLYFLADDCGNALKVLNELLTSKLSHGSERLVRIFWLMIQYEIENVSQLQEEAARVHHWLTKSKVVSEEENEIILFFGKIHKAVGKKEVELRMSELQNLLVRDETRHTDASSIENSSLLTWLESKLTKIPMHQILQSKIVR